MTAQYRLFGADAAHQRADAYAHKHGLTVYQLGTSEAPFSRYGLDPWGRNPDDEIVYSFVAVPLSNPQSNGDER